MHHLAVFAENVNQNLGAITPIVDEILTVNGDNLKLDQETRAILGCIFGGPTISAARIVAKSLRGLFNGGGPDFSPLNVGAEPLSPTPYHDLRDMPIFLPTDEDVQVHIANGGAEDAWAGLVLASGPIAPQRPTNLRTIRGTLAAAAVTAEAWGNARALTLGQDLANGIWGVYGGYAVSTSGRFFRLGGLLDPASGKKMGYRPGGLMGDAESDILAPTVFRHGGLGLWGAFKHDAPPTVYTMCDAADNEVVEVYLDVAPLRLEA